VLTRLASVVLTIVLALPEVSAQEPPDLRQQLQALKQQYEQTTRDLQQRIAALEQQIDAQKSPVLRPEWIEAEQSTLRPRVNRGVACGVDSC
jgi:esterase/lipase